MTTHEVLVAARNLIERDGWFALDPNYRTRHQEGTSPHCVLTAIRCCGRSEQEIMVAQEAMGEIVGCVPAQWLAVWNDAPERTKEEVLAAFDKAIAATAPEPDTSFLPEQVEEPVPA